MEKPYASGGIIRWQTKSKTEFTMSELLDQIEDVEQKIERNQFKSKSNTCFSA